MNRFNNKIAVVTGAAHGIGRAIAQRLHAEGATVALLDRDEAGMEEAIATLGGGARVVPILADCLQLAALTAAFEQIRSDLGEVDVLVNNVGFSLREHKAPFDELQPAAWQAMLDACLLPAMACCSAVVGSMKRRGTGRIVNIASDSALVGSRLDAPYSAAKAGVIGFSRSLARELAPFGVTVNAVAPGYIRTRAMSAIAPSMIEKAVAETPLGRLGEASEVAAAVAFFGSDDASFVTGQTLIVNGGRWFN